MSLPAEWTLPLADGDREHTLSNGNFERDERSEPERNERPEPQPHELAEAERVTWSR